MCMFFLEGEGGFFAIPKDSPIVIWFKPKSRITKPLRENGVKEGQAECHLMNQLEEYK